MVWRVCLLILLLIGVFPDSAPARAISRDCLPYETDGVKLTGRIITKTFPGPPNFQSIKKGDRPEAAWILRLAKPICVKADSRDEYNETEHNVLEIQLALTGDQFSQIRRLSRKGAVAITGQLFHAHTGHHHTRVLLAVSKVGGK